MADYPMFELSEDAWRTYREHLYKFIVKRVPDEFIAEDITQEVLMRVYLRLASLQAREKFLPWLYQIARNAIVDYYRRAHHDLELDDTALLTTLDLDDGPSAYDQLTPCLLPLIKQLPATYQAAIQYAEIDNLTQKKVAEKLGISLPGAKSRVQRGRKLLKELLFQCCPIPLDTTGQPLDFQAKPSCDVCHPSPCDS